MPKPPSSARGSSSHRSTLEPRGPPEFDREYARQLSLAKRGRSSVRASPRTDGSGASPAGEARSPGPEIPLPPRLRELVAARTLDSRPGRPSLPLGSARAHTPRGETSDSVTQRPPSPAQRLDGRTDGPGVESDDGHVEDVRPPKAAAGFSLGGTLGILVGVWALLFLLSCAVSLAISEDAGYRPAYFTGVASTADPQPFRPSGLDRYVPQVSRQLALRVRRGLHSVAASVTPLRLLTAVVGDVVGGARLGVGLLHRYVLQPIISAAPAVIGPGRRSVGRAVDAMWATWRPPPLSVRGGLSTFKRGLSAACEGVVVAPLRGVRWVLVRPPRWLARSSYRVAQRALTGVRRLLPGGSSSSSTPGVKPAVAPARPAAAKGPSLAARLRSAAAALWRKGGTTAKAPLVTVERTVRVHAGRDFTGDLWSSLLRERPNDLTALVQREVEAAIAGRGRPLVRTQAVDGSLVVTLEVERTVKVRVPTGDTVALDAQLQAATQQLQSDMAAKVRSYSFKHLLQFYSAAAARVASVRSELEAAHQSQERLRQEREAARSEAAATAQRLREVEMELEQQRAATSAAAAAATAAAQGRAKAPASPCEGLVAFAEKTAKVRAGCAKEVAAVCDESVRVAKTKCEASAAAAAVAAEKARAACVTEESRQAAKLKQACDAAASAAAASTAKQMASLNATHAASLKQLRAQCEAADKSVASLRSELSSLQGAQAERAAEVARVRQVADACAANATRCHKQLAEMAGPAACAAAVTVARAEAGRSCQAQIDASLQSAAAAGQSRASAECEARAAEAAVVARRERAAAVEAATAAAAEAWGARLAACQKDAADALEAEALLKRAAIAAASATGNRTAAALLEVQAACAEQQRLLAAGFAEERVRLTREQAAACRQERAALVEQWGLDKDQSVRAARAAATAAALAAAQQQCAANMTAAVAEARRAAAMAACAKKGSGAQAEAPERRAAHASGEQRAVAAAVDALSRRANDSAVALRGLIAEARARCVGQCRGRGATRSATRACEAALARTTKTRSAPPPAAEPHAMVEAAVAELRGLLLSTPSTPSAGYCGVGWQVSTPPSSRTCPPNSWRRTLKKLLTCLAVGFTIAGSLYVAGGQYRRAAALARENAALVQALRKATGSGPRKGPSECGAAAPLEQTVAAYFEAMGAWHLTCCSLLAEHDARAAAQDADPAPSRHTGGGVGGAGAAGRLLSPSVSGLDSSNSSQTLPFPAADARGAGLGLGRLSAAPAVSPERLDGAPPHALSGALSKLWTQAAHVYFDTLEAYYVDLLEAVTSRELVGEQLAEMAAVAAKQAAVLERQSGNVVRLQRGLDEERGAHQRRTDELQAECAELRQRVAEGAATTDTAELSKARRMIRLQAEMLSVLEEQLRRATATDGGEGGALAAANSRSSAARLPGHVPAAAHRDPQLAWGALEGTPRARSAGALASPMPIRTASAASSARSTPSRARPSPRASGGGPGSTMVRSADTVRRYRQLDWEDVGGTEGADSR